MARVVPPIEIDFETGNCVETLEAKVAAIAEKLRSIRNPWTGNKRKLLVDIFRTIDNEGIEYDSFLDLFAGSSVVGITAKKLGKRVVSNDLMTFSYLSCLSFVESDGVSLSIDEQKYLFENRSGDAGRFVRDRYAGIRFTELEAEFLDNFRRNLIDLFGTEVVGNEKSAHALVHVLHHVMECCFVGGRLNKGQVLADLEHRLQHARNRGQQMTFRNIFWTNVAESNGQQNRAYNLDAIRLLEEVRPDVQVGYIDPPYGGSQSDYSFMYSFFEEYIHQSPLDSLPHIQSCNKFSGASDYYKHFDLLLSSSSYIPVLVISYNDSSWASIDDIAKVVSKHRRDVRLHTVEYDYKYRKQASDEQSKEYLIVAR
ncbi:MAG: hypothetical protein HC888_02360 [Candidatus Competibacteraceae bacterium]|nr:hypothetical protein [Candidatus Competibacteraceae bacterium]